MLLNLSTFTGFGEKSIPVISAILLDRLIGLDILFCRANRDYLLIYFYSSVTSPVSIFFFKPSKSFKVTPVLSFLKPPPSSLGIFFEISFSITC
jgi:hypothetical protein